MYTTEEEKEQQERDKEDKEATEELRRKLMRGQIFDDDGSPLYPLDEDGDVKWMPRKRKTPEERLKEVW